jgi:putative ABC transport system permease protein
MSNRASLQEAARVAFASLSGSSLRSFLTLLGIILATTTLIAVMSVIHGMDVYIARQVSDMGAEGFRIRRIVMMGKFDAKKYLEMEKKHPTMSRDEYDFLRQRATLVRDIGLEAFWGVKLKYQGKTLDWVDCQAVTANMGGIQNVQLTSGRYISDTDDSRHLPVAIIGNDVAQEYFPSIDPVGKTILISGHQFEVIGVAKPKGSIFGESQDKFVTIPIGTFYKMFGGDMNSKKTLGYNASAIDQAHLQQAQDEVRALLRSYRHLRPNQDDNFGMMASDSLSALWDQLTGAIAGTAMAVVSVFLLVGGVVIMNIMLAVVTERTREIGIRKSVGARSKDILNQFLIESSMLSGMGGLIGVAISYVLALIVKMTTPVPMVVPMSAIVIGVGMSSVVGLFFGIYPAKRAAQLDPIEALRYE